jgi:PAS domain S-box-containing protein
VPIRDADDAVTQLVIHMVDRTEQDIAERALHVARSRFHGVFEHAATGIAIADWDGRLLECNAAYAALIGYTRDELSRMSIPDILHADDREANMALVQRLQRGEVPSFEVENRYVRRDGRPVMVHKYVSVLPDASGRPAQLMALVTDVTVRRQAEEQGRWEAARNDLLLRLLRDQLDSPEPAAILATAAEGLARLVGAPRVGFFGVDGDVLTRTICWTDGSLPALSGAIPVGVLGPTLLSRSGSGENTAIEDAAAFDWLPDSIPGLADIGAAVIAPIHREGRWCGGLYVHDATARAWQPREVALIGEVAHQAWENVERLTAQASLRLALDASAAGVWSLDLESRQVALDDRTRTLFGFSSSETVTFETMSQRLHDEDRIHVTTRLENVRANAGQDAWDMEFRIQRPDGAVAWVYGIGRAARDASGQAVRLGGINLDVTVRKNAEAALREVRDQQREHARDSEQRLRRLASDLTLTEQHARERLARTLHDGLQQLLFGAALKIDRAIKGRGDADLLKRARADVQDAIEAARSLSVELFPPALRQGGLPAALQWLADWVHQKYGTTVEVAADPRANPADEDVRLLLFESVRELLFNAVKHARVSRVTLSLSLTVTDRLCIRVADDGVGFDAAAAFASAGTPRGGLGLFGIRERLTLLGGDFEVETAPGRGSSFTLCVQRGTAPSTPAGGGTRATEPEPAGAPAGTAPPLRRLRVLLADDHGTVRDGLRELLAEQPQLEVIGEASDGLDAVAMAGAFRPDVVVMDVSMPRLDGIEATRRIRAEWPSIRVVGLSTDDRPEGRHAIEEAGAVAYFSKNDGAAALIAQLLDLYAHLDGGTASGV